VDMAGEGPDEGPYDRPGGPDLPVDDVLGNPAGSSENYRREQINRSLSRGGRGCFFPPTILVAVLALVAIGALVGR